MRRGIEPVGGDAHIAPHSRVSGKAPLCKGGCHGIAVTGGLFTLRRSAHPPRPRLRRHGVTGKFFPLQQSILGIILPTLHRMGIDNRGRLWYVCVRDRIASRYFALVRCGQWWRSCLFLILPKLYI